MRFDARLYIAIAAVLGTLPVAAQESGTAGAPAATGGLDEIVVTAQKRSENLQEVPIAISAVNGQALTDTGIHDATDLKLAVPSLNMTNSNGRLTSTLRGVGTIAVGAGFENPVALYVDNVYYATTTASVMSLNDIAQVAVLKGPQGTLFGRNATAGLIQITTRDPSTDPGASINLGYANYETESANGYVGGHVTSTLSGDIAVSYVHQNEGWGHNLYDGEDIYQLNHDTNVRSKWVFKPVDGTRFTLIGDYEENANTQNPLHLLPGTANSWLPGAPQVANYGYNSYTNYDSFTHLADEGVSLRYEQDLPFAALASTSAYRKSVFSVGFDYDGIQNPLGSIYFKQEDSQITQEITLSSLTRSPISWVAGAFYYHGDSGYAPFLRDFSYLGDDFTIYEKTVSDSLAGFAQGSWEFVKDTHLTLGVRYTSEKRYAMDGSTQITLVPADHALPTTYAPNASLDFDKITYRAALDHQFTDDLLGYVSFNTGFKAGGFNTASPGSAPFLPESLKSYEVGFKSELFDKRIRLNAAGFYYDYKNIQVQELQVGKIVIINGSSARIYGLDSDLEAEVTSNFKITSALSWVAPNYRAFPGCQLGTPYGATAVTTGSCADKQLPLATKISANLAGDYTIALPAGSLLLNANIYFNDGFYEEPDNAYRQPSFAQLGALVRWTAPGDHFDTSLWGKNLTDREVINYETTLPNGAHTGYYQAPRTYGINVEYKF